MRVASPKLCSLGFGEILNRWKLLKQVLVVSRELLKEAGTILW